MNRAGSRRGTRRRADLERAARPPTIGARCAADRLVPCRATNECARDRRCGAWPTRRSNRLAARAAPNNLGVPLPPRASAKSLAGSPYCVATNPMRRKLSTIVPWFAWLRRWPSRQSFPTRSRRCGPVLQDAPAAWRPSRPDSERRPARTRSVPTKGGGGANRCASRPSPIVCRPACTSATRSLPDTRGRPSPRQSARRTTARAGGRSRRWKTAVPLARHEPGSRARPTPTTPKTVARRRPPADRSPPGGPRPRPGSGTVAGGRNARTRTPCRRRSSKHRTGRDKNCAEPVRW